MAITVGEAFEKFLLETINLDREKTKAALQSRDWLFGQIEGFQGDATFPKWVKEYNLPYGSFARKTKKRPLDDIDLMVGLHAQGGSYDEMAGNERLHITVNPSSNLLPFCFDGTYSLNSTKVINKFIKKLSCVAQYSSSEIKRNGSAAVLSLKSYDWSFDIVPCFMTAPGLYTPPLYLIPDGNGLWKKTDPRVDRERVSEINQDRGGRVLPIIRVMKYWNHRPTMPTMSSYLLEAMILDHYSSVGAKLTGYMDLDIPHLFDYIAGAVKRPVYDPKGIEGNINNIPWEEVNRISQRASLDALRAFEAVGLENSETESSINKWREIFGRNFPAYG